MTNITLSTQGLNLRSYIYLISEFLPVEAMVGILSNSVMDEELKVCKEQVSCLFCLSCSRVRCMSI